LAGWGGTCDLPDVRRALHSLRWLAAGAAGAVAAAVAFAALAGCSGKKPELAPRTPATTQPATLPTIVVARPPPPPAEHWYFEWLSRDGKRALLRRLDTKSRATFHARMVDVDSGATMEEAKLEELAKVPFETIGRLPRLDTLLGTSGLGDDLVRGAHLVGAFPLGSGGRISAAPDGSAIAFNAGDWLYVADKNGRIKRRLAEEASYDPRFTPDGRHLIFRRLSAASPSANGAVRGKYELFVVPTDLSKPPQRLEGTAGTRDRVVIAADGQSAISISSLEPQIKTCVLSVSMRAPFGVKKMACLDGGEQLVDSLLSPTGKWVAVMTSKHDVKTEALSFRLRVVALANGKVAHDAPMERGVGLRAISDEGVLVQSGPQGIFVDDVPAKSRRLLTSSIDLGFRAFFRNASEIVYVRDRDVRVVDLARE
jgi:hypothetical protein